MRKVYELVKEARQQVEGEQKYWGGPAITEFHASKHGSHFVCLQML